MIKIRSEIPADKPAVRAVNIRAFGRPDEADIVDRLRAACPDLVSLVATDGATVVGHILFSPAVIEGPDREIEGMGLAPMAVLPEYQRRGIGSDLVAAGLAALMARACPFVIVLGHPEYYPRFGFVPASRHGVRCPWDGIPDDVFMMRVLDEAAMHGVAGRARYRPEFDVAV